MKVIGGGFTSTQPPDTDIETRWSGPEGEETWTVAYDPAGGAQASVVATAICASVAATSTSGD